MHRLETMWATRVDDIARGAATELAQLRCLTAVWQAEAMQAMAVQRAQSDALDDGLGLVRARLAALQAEHGAYVCAQAGMQEQGERLDQMCEQHRNVASDVAALSTAARQLGAVARADVTAMLHRMEQLRYELRHDLGAAAAHG